MDIEPTAIRSSLESNGSSEGQKLGVQQADRFGGLFSTALTLSVTGGVVALVAWIIATFGKGSYSQILSFICYLLAYGLCSFELVAKLGRTLRSGRFKFDVDLLMLVAALGAASIEHWAEGALLLFLFSAANALEESAMGKARKAIRSLGQLTPLSARVLRNEMSVQVPLEQVEKGAIIVVYPAERIPFDGIVVKGRSAVNQASITGESVPVDKSGGDSVYAGSVNGDSVLEIRTTSIKGDRTIDRIIKLVEEAEAQRAPTQIFAEKFERIFVPCVLLLAGGMIVVPSALGTLSMTESFYRAMTLLVGASPCALALGTPSAVIAGIAQAARNGILVKGGAHLEMLGALRCLAFDKTGTLTTGRPVVTDVVPSLQSSEQELLLVAASIESQSQHPLGKAVVAAAEERALALKEVTELESVTARGLRARIDGEIVGAGSVRLFEGTEIPTEISDITANLQRRGRSIILLKKGTRWLGALGILDVPRPNVHDILTRLRQLGVDRLVMLTGDNAGIGKTIASEVGITDVRADLLPEDKVSQVKQLLLEERFVGMVGDGVNDAPALAYATVGICMGGAGTAIALETADVALMGDDLSRLPFAIALSRQAGRVIKQNLYISLSVMAFLIVFSLFGFVGIGPAVVLHEGSTLVVIANSLRLLRYSPNA